MTRGTGAWAALLLACCAAEPVGEVARPEPTQAPSVAPAAVADAAVATPPGLRSVTVAADDGHPIAVHVKRPARARAAVVLVHGRTWSGLPDFDLQVPGESVSLMDALVAADVAAYAVDLRGYGGTPRDATGFVTPRRSAGDVAAALKFAAEDAGVRPHLLGWSMGALVSALLLQANPAPTSRPSGPELVEGVVLYGYPCRAGRPVKVRAPEPTTPAKYANTAAAAASDFITPGSVSKAVVDEFVAAALKADPVKADWRGGAEWDAIDFAKIKVPVLVIHGERDPVTDRACMAENFNQLVGVDRRWDVLAGGDHAAHLERTGFAAAVLGFVLSRRGG